MEESFMPQVGMSCWGRRPCLPSTRWDGRFACQRRAIAPQELWRRSAYVAGFRESTTRTENAHDRSDHPDSRDRRSYWSNRRTHRFCESGARRFAGRPGRVGVDAGRVVREVSTGRGCRPAVARNRGDNTGCQLSDQERRPCAGRMFKNELHLYGLWNLVSDLSYPRIKSFWFHPDQATEEFRRVVGRYATESTKVTVRSTPLVGATRGVDA